MKIGFDTFRRVTAFNWVLIVAFLVTCLFPAHMHLNHVETADQTTHEHVIDLHTSIIDSNELATNSAYTPAFDLNFDTVTKLAKFMSLMLALLVFSIFLILNNKQPRNSFIRKLFFSASSNEYHIPQLRAPPAL